jgi:hypothetical protein
MSTHTYPALMTRLAALSILALIAASRAAAGEKPTTKPLEAKVPPEFVTFNSTPEGNQKRGHH